MTANTVRIIMAKKKPKDVPLADIKIGLQVVVIERLDAQIYTVKEVAQAGRIVHLCYTCNDTEMSGGWIDYGVCLYPSTAQLKYAKEHQ
jgi:hypothetical protein